jgi:hypothetical protein
MHKIMKLALGMTFVFLILATAGYAQSGSLTSNSTRGSFLAGATQNSVPPSSANTTGNVLPPSYSGFTATCLYHNNYVGSYNCGNISGVHPWSKVFVSVCEYWTDYNYCGQGLAYPRITNVVPFEGRVQIGVDPNWGSAINFRVSLYIEP